MASATAQSDIDASEVQPLIRPLPPALVGRLCFSAVLIALVASWCLLDSWNRQVTSELFTGTKPQVHLSFEETVKNGNIEDVQPVASISAGVQSFEYPLTLVFLQFTVMAVVFSLLWWMTSPEPARDLCRFQATMSDARWTCLAITHVFSTFWLQTLVMPSSKMSLGLFAISRAVEIPAAAVLRSSIMSTRLGSKGLMTTLLMFGAACTLIYAYTQIMNCVCIWSGFGVALSGPSFYLISTLLLVLPAACAVCQEVALVEFEIPVSLVLAFQSVCASLVCGVGLYIARILDWEDCVIALRILVESPRLYMLTLWLCIQLAATAWVTLQIISMTDSFWGVALKSTRVIYWQMYALYVFYANSSIPYSVARPRSSLWSFVLVCGIVLCAAAVYSDPQKKDKAGRDAHKATFGMAMKV